MKSIRICITGGHATPALAVVDVMKKRHPDWKFLWVGRTVAIEGSGVVSEEPRLVGEANIPFYPISAGRLNRFFSFESIVSFFKIPIGFFQSFFLLLRHRPTVVCSFGGYVALPVAMGAFLLGVPVVTHEQTHKPGLANRIIGMIARNIFVSHKETLRFFPKGKTIYTGLPIRPQIFDVPQKPSFPYAKDDLPILYVMGGSTGAESLNTIMYPMLPMLLPRYRVVHQVGALSYEKAREVKEALSRYQDRYIPVAYLAVSDLAWVYHHSKLVVGRSGANTVGELLALGKRTICIPLPWGGDHEQERNARELVDADLGMILLQSNLTPEKLTEAIERMTEEKKKNVTYTEQEPHAAETITDTVEQLL